MNWFRLAAFTLAWAALGLIGVRTDRRARRAALVFFTVPGVCLLCFWAYWRQQYGEFWLGLGAGLAITLIWWLVWGRRMPPPDSDNIKVWGQE